MIYHKRTLRVRFFLHHPLVTVVVAFWTDQSYVIGQIQKRQIEEEEEERKRKEQESAEALSGLKNEKRNF